MATIIQKPDTLSISRNLKELIISTSSEISLQLLKGDSMLLEETYLPDVNNRVHVDLADIVTSTLSLTMPSGDAVSTSQSSVYSDFTVKVDGTSMAEFTAVRSGVERFSDTAANFLTANWLTWQPQVKEVLHDQPEWLTYYPASGSCACYARFYYTDGTSGEIKVCDVSQCVSINTRFSKLWALDESGKERYGVIDVYIKDAQGLRLTYVQRYVLCSQGALDEVYLCENSLGGLDTFRFYGDRKLVPEIGYTSLLLDNSYTAADPDLSRKWSQNTGMLTGRECEWCWELFRSSAAYHLYRGTILPIVLDASSVEKSAMSVLAAYSFDYRYASDLGLLNVVRSENLPEVVEISGPDAEVFFLTPRLNEFPSAVLSDDLIIPVQSPYEESWYTLSVGGLKSALLSSVETIYGPMWHEHDNLQVLNGLSVDSSGNLLYNGVQVGSGIVGAHDHHGETIRPEKIIVGDVEITCVDGRLHISKGLVSDGDIAAFGAEEGEEGGSGGLDIARLWEELAAEDASKVINVSHIPGSVVLQDELIEVLDDYPLTTEMNEALSGKAGKDWVEEELTKYLLLTGGKISGDLEVTGTLKIGDAVLSYADGRLHVSSTVTSDGDFVAFGDEEGSTGSGGLDVARLWEELEAPGTKQIDVSHIPDIKLSKISDLHTSWDSVLASQKPAWLTAVSLSTIRDLHASWDDMLKAQKPTTLAGYGIKDAYTKTEIDEELTKYVTIADNQDITGVKTFVNGIKIGSISLSVVDGRLHVSSTVTSDGDFVAFGDEDGASGSGGLDVARLWQELEADDSSKVIDVSHIPSITKAKISDFPTKWAWADISGKPSTFAPSAHSHAISDVTGLQGELNSKWVWSESQVKAVKVNSAASADNADTLDGIHANGLLTALTSNATTNLSLTVGGKPLSVTNLYAKYADQLRTARKINGTSFNGASDITTVKWGMARLVSIKDYTQDNTGATKSVDGSAGFSLLLLQSIKVKTLDVDGVTLSVVDGRLHISATATSAGDFVAYGDEAGSSGSGGLDISRLWEELEAKDSSKVIDITHIPAIPTSKITGLGSYATQAWVKQQGYLASVSLATISDLNSSWDALLKVAPTKYVTRWPTASEVGALTQTAADGRYLRLAGGTMCGDITFSAGAIYLGTADGFDRTIVGYNETSGAMLFFDGTRTVVGSYGAHSTAATHIRSKTGHATIGAGNTASYTILDTGNYTGVLDSRYVNVSGDTLTGPLKFVSNGNRYLTLSEAGLRWDFSDVTDGHAHNWLRVTEPDGSSYAGMGVYGGADGLNYIYLGGSYTAPWIVLRPSGNVGIGITSPSYRLHVGGNAYVSGTIYASSSFNLTSNRGRFVFDGSSDATWLQGMAGKNMAISAMNGGTLPKLSLYADLVQANHDLAVSGSVKIGSITLTDSGGRLHVSSTVTSDGDFVAFGDEEGSGGSGGLDVARLWEELVAKDSSKVIDITHIPSIPVDKVTGLSGAVSTITTANLTASRALVSNTSGKVAVSAVTATELGYLDGVTSKIQTQLNNRLPLSGGTMSGSITLGGEAYLSKCMSLDTSNYEPGLLWRDKGNTKSIAGIGYWNTAQALYLNPCYDEVDNVYNDAVGKYNLRIGKNSLTYNTYSILHSGNYTSTLDSRYMRIGSSGYPTAYRKIFNINGTAWSFLGTTTDAPTVYAPTTAGTTGYVLQSTGGTPAWAAQNSLVVKGIYERSLGVAAGDTMADLKSALTTQMGSGLNKPGSMGFVTAASISNIMPNWANDDYKLVAGARTNFLRLDGYESSTYGVFLVSGYQGSFYRLLKNSSTAWGGPYLILDTGNYSSTLDSRYVNISGDTMTGRLTLGDSSRLNLVVGGTTRMAVYDDGDYTIFGDPDYKACIRGSRIIFQNATGSNGLVMEDDTFTFKGNSIWHAGNDGPGSGLNADQLDGYQASSFLLKSGGTMTGTLTVPSLYVNTLAYIYESASHATRLTMQWSGGIARIYAINNSGSGYYDMSLGQTPGNSGALYFDASAACWGIGTTSPAYKLDVAGTLRATGLGTFGALKITSTSSVAHLTFGRTDAFNYISLPGDSSTLAIAPGGDISGAGSALCISNSATYPGYHNGTINLGQPSYRWKNVYSVLGNFSDLVTAGSIAVTDKLYIPSPDGNQRYYIKFE